MTKKKGKTGQDKHDKKQKKTTIKEKSRQDKTR